ncbi:XTP/dITP diphosphatase [Hornefia butyriciproducens]|jgi:XTP/dITP diphosphohydrolase|uniref:dITP/XTP pyrophosphatase n=1 Tax=Hornefia butyriciproducens TaxID=2652293 RepID=A0A6L5Y6E7_9FIRM|nr:XTP/dITP diphosphatase [Hornefia butyriciproducens]MCI7326435.1 XTP/dITP diphosphatase [Clostridiales bacterium]MCI7412724.1 XTP/dITP diphosphatase [Clostridiales bacterium]MCI7679551.1 XTP/dITP diphosphatase [Clostridiales bacterium]MDD6299471.1 XTP/dITP diphosphatase [Hornefia butyriciproducens]MDD7019858.1 XTP/dITP diphosphatase [Hornefia butyriciproducens]
MELIIAASKNANKIREMNEITAKLGLHIISRDEAGLPDVEIEEDGATFEENSFKKANEIMKLSGHIAIADDSGLEVEYLHEAPGVYSARFAGEDASDEKNNEKLLSLMEDLPYRDRRARFVSVITMVWPDGRKLVARGECEGHILTEPIGENGFGYDPLFVPDGYQRTFAQLSAEEKNRISHRAKALTRLAEMLKGNE